MLGYQFVSKWNIISIKKDSLVLVGRVLLWENKVIGEVMRRGFLAILFLEKNYRRCRRKNNKNRVKGQRGLQFIFRRGLIPFPEMNCLRRGPEDSIDNTVKGRNKRQLLSGIGIILIFLGSCVSGPNKASRQVQGKGSEDLIFSSRGLTAHEYIECVDNVKLSLYEIYKAQLKSLTKEVVDQPCVDQESFERAQDKAYNLFLEQEESLKNIWLKAVCAKKENIELTPEQEFFFSHFYWVLQIKENPYFERVKACEPT